MSNSVKQEQYAYNTTQCGYCLRERTLCVCITLRRREPASTTVANATIANHELSLIIYTACNDSTKVIIPRVLSAITW